MTYKSLMVHMDLDGDNGDVLNIAAELAGRFDARVIGIAACQPLQVTSNERFAAEAVINQDKATIARDMAAVEAQFRKALDGRAHGLQWRSRVGLDPLADFLAEEARAADLIITSRNRGVHVFDDTRRVDIGDLVMRAGRPVLIVPKGVKGLPLRNVFVGWKESREARRAVSDALPLLREARRTIVLDIAPEHQVQLAQEGAEDVVSWLAAHDVHAVPQALTLIGSEAAHLKTELIDRKCDLFVAGAYGHSRLSEWAFGGVTQDMLLNPDFCVLISH